MAMFLSLLLALLSPQQTASVTGSADHREQIKSLLEKLNPHVVDQKESVMILSPTPETNRAVYAELSNIAAESPEARAYVIEALIKEVEKPPNLEVHFGTNVKWTAAVNLLGDLRATEAINTLVKNLGQTGEVGFISETHCPASRALRAIGEPAVPRLIEVLSDKNPYIRYLAASTLAEIGEPAFIQVQEALNSNNIETRCGAALAIGLIGGKESRIAIEKAISRETNRKVLKRLQDALKHLIRD